MIKLGVPAGISFTATPLPRGEAIVLGYGAGRPTKESQGEFAKNVSLGGGGNEINEVVRNEVRDYNTFRRYHIK